MKELIVKFYEKYADYAYRVALVRTNNKADAEDLAQEVVLKIIRNQDILKELIDKDESQAKGYLAKAVVNMTIERYKKSSSRLKREIDYANSKMIAIDDSDFPDNSDENKHAILKAIKDLPEKYQTIIMLKFYEGHSNTELSNILNLKEVSIRSLISRAIQKLKNQLAATSVTLSIASITENLESTNLVFASPEFKAKLIQNINNHYEELPLATSGSTLILKATSFVILGLFLSFVFFKYEFFQFNKHLNNQQNSILPGTTQGNKNEAVVNQPLYSLELDMNPVTSKSELNDLVNTKLDFKKNEKLLISYEKKGIIAVGSETQILKLPYTLKPEKPIVVFCEAELLSLIGQKKSAVGLDLKLFSPVENQNTLFYNNDKIYFMKFTIFDKTLFAESSLFDGIITHGIYDSGYHSTIGIQAANVIIRRIKLHEMAPEELNHFKEKNATHIQAMVEYRKKNPQK